MRRRGARVSQVVNNFFTFATIIIIAVVISLYSKYVVKDESEIKVVEKLQCEKTALTKIKILNQKLLDKSIKALNKGYYKIEGAYLKSLKMPSSIEKVISLEEVDALYEKAIGVKAKKNLEKFLKIRYELIETDKIDNKKISAGTLISSFRIGSNEIFRITTDFNFMYKNAIKKRVDCSIKVYKNHVNATRK